MRFGNLIPLLSIFFLLTCLSRGESINTGIDGNSDFNGTQRPRERMRKWLNQQLTHEQQTILHEHINVLRAKHSELNEILKNGSSEYARLSTKDILTPEDRRSLVELRQKLITNSIDAKQKLHEIRELNRKFKDENPDIIPLNPRARPLKRGIHEIQRLKGQIDNLLAEDSTEYAELIKKRHKTQDDFARIAELRRQLIRKNEHARILADQARAVRRLMRGKMREHRLKRRERRRNQLRRFLHEGNSLKEPE